MNHYHHHVLRHPNLGYSFVTASLINISGGIIIDCKKIYFFLNSSIFASSAKLD